MRLPNVLCPVSTRPTPVLHVVRILEVAQGTGTAYDLNANGNLTIMPGLRMTKSARLAQVPSRGPAGAGLASRFVFLIGSEGQSVLYSSGKYIHDATTGRESLQMARSGGKHGRHGKP